MIFQGDFGKGQITGNGVFTDPGANPCLLDGPVPVNPGVNDQGLFYPKFRVGQTINGDYGTEFIYCKIVVGSVTDFIPGQAYFWDERFNATLMSATNSSNILNAEAGILNVWSPAQPAGTYYGWMQRAGHAAVQAAAGSVATGSGETGGVAGQLKFPASKTAGQKSVLPATAFLASSGIAFTGNTINGQPYITAVVNAAGAAFSPIEDLCPGMVITGTGLPANAIISAIDKNAQGWRISIGTNTPGSYSVPQNCTATGVGVTFTVTSHVVANIYWPTLAAQN